MPHDGSGTLHVRDVSDILDGLDDGDVRNGPATVISVKSAIGLIPGMSVMTSIL